MNTRKLQWLEALATKANAADQTRVDQVLERANRFLGGRGVKFISGNYWHNYFGSTVALYVDIGYAYSTTLLYDVVENEFLVTAWADWAEAFDFREEEDN